MLALPRMMRIIKSLEVGNHTLYWMTMTQGRKYNGKAQMVESLSTRLQSLNFYFIIESHGKFSSRRVT